MINDNLSLGKKVKELRLSHSLTQDQVAKALNVTPGYISNVENERITMSLRVLIYYARLTNSSLDALVGTIDPSYHTTALDNEIMRLLRDISDEDKQKLIDTLKIWFAGANEK